jgi:hypothetical protein
VFSSDGRRAFVTNNSKADHMADPAHAGHAGGEAGDAKPMKGNVTVLDTRTMEVEKVIELGANVTGMGHSPG